MHSELLSFLQTCKGGDKFKIGYYDFDLIEEINLILKSRMMSATYYGDECMMMIFNK